MTLVSSHQTPAAATIAAAAARVHKAVLVRVERRGVVRKATTILEGNLSISLKMKFFHKRFVCISLDESSKTVHLQAASTDGAPVQNDQGGGDLPSGTRRHLPDESRTKGTINFPQIRIREKTRIYGQFS